MQNLNIKHPLLALLCSLIMLNTEHCILKKGPLPASVAVQPPKINKNTTSSQHKINEATKGNKHSALVLLHGLGGNAAEFTIMKQTLEEKCPKKYLVIAINLGKDTFDKKIPKQAAIVYEYIKNTPSLQNSDLLLVGFCSGGLVLYEMSRQYREAFKAIGINLLGLCTISTPWKGVAVLNDQSQQSLKKLIKLLGPCLAPEELEELKQLLAIYNPEKTGVQDLKPASSFIADTQNSLEKSDLPILALAGVMEEPILTFLQHSKPHKASKLAQCKPLRSWLNKLLCGTEQGKYDLIMPVESQLATGVPTKSNFKRKTCNNVLHLNIPQIGALNHKDIIQAVIQFIEAMP